MIEMISMKTLLIGLFEEKFWFYDFVLDQSATGVKTLEKYTRIYTRKNYIDWSSTVSWKMIPSHF